MSRSSATVCGSCDREPAEGESPLQRCSRCHAVYYCSPSCQRVAWESHKTTCHLPGLVRSEAATTLTPAKCGACKGTANLVCNGCSNMTYCSSVCQMMDRPIHEIFCSAFKDFQTRPGPDFNRAIYFPEQGGDPHFVWIESEGSRYWKNLTGNTTEKYLGEGGWRTLDFDDDKRFGRTFDHQLSIYHRSNFLIDGSGVNHCLAPFIGYSNASRWRGPFLATSRKYKDIEMDYGAIEPQDQYPGGEFDEFPLLPMDLDTTSLSPVLAHLQFMARSQQ